MEIIINGTRKTFLAPLNMADLLLREGYADKTVAVALNGAFVPKSTHSDTPIENGAEIEIVAPMHGG